MKTFYKNGKIVGLKGCEGFDGEMRLSDSPVPFEVREEHNRVDARSDPAPEVQSCEHP